MYNDFDVEPTGGKLKQIFVDPESSRQTSLTYTAPKQPKPQQQKAQPARDAEVAMKLIHASSAHAYQYDNATRQYAPKGKVGIAVLGNKEARKFQFLAYVSSKEHLFKAAIDPKFMFTIQPNMYVAVYDEKSQPWSLRFEAQEELNTFGKHVAMAKAESGDFEALVSQDLVAGEGPSLVPGDSAEVRYTGWINQGGVEGKVFDSNMKKEKAFRFKLGKGKVIRGWDEGLVGMKKGGKRYLVVPSNLAYGQKGFESVVPPNSVLNFEIHVLRIKSEKEAGSDAPANDMPLPTLPGGSSRAQEDYPGAFDDEDDMRGRSSSNISESKAEILSRIAKMGSSTLPRGGIPGVSNEDESAYLQQHQQSPQRNFNQQQQYPQGQFGQQGNFQDGFGQNQMQGQMQQGFGNSMLQGQLQNPMPNQMQNPMLQNQMQNPMLQNQMMQNQMQNPMLQNQLMQNQMQLQGQGQNPMLQNQLQLQLQPFQQQPQAQPQALALYQPQFQQPQVQPQFVQPVQVAPVPAPAPAPAPVAQPEPKAEEKQVVAALPSEAMLLLRESREDAMTVKTTQSFIKTNQDELRNTLTSVATRVEDMAVKIDRIYSSPILTSGQEHPKAFDGVELLRSVQRIISDNDRLRKEVSDKMARIDTLNEKVSDLVSKNERLIEERNQMLERRNESMRQTSEQSQDVLSRIQSQKATLETEFANLSSEFSTAQRQLTTLRLTEKDLRETLEKTERQLADTKEELEASKTAQAVAEERGKKLEKAVKDERAAKKELAQRIASLEDELAESLKENETLRTLGDERKKKYLEENSRLEKMYEDFKRQHEEQLNVLRETLRKERLQTGTVMEEQVKRIEIEAEELWKAKLERRERELEKIWSDKLADLEVRHQNHEKELADKERLSIRDAIEGALKNARAEFGVERQKMEDQQASLGQNIRSLEKQLKEKEAELELERERKADDVTAAVPKEVIGDEIKKIMNAMYYRFRSSFDDEVQYEADDIMTIIMSIIKETTIKALKSQNEEEEEEEEEEDEEEEEQEEEEGEGEEQAQEEEQAEEDQEAKEEQEEQEEEAKEEEVVVAEEKEEEAERPEPPKREAQQVQAQEEQESSRDELEGFVNVKADSRGSTPQDISAPEEDDFPFDSAIKKDESSPREATPPPEDTQEAEEEPFTDPLAQDFSSLPVLPDPEAVEAEEKVADEEPAFDAGDAPGIMESQDNGDEPFSDEETPLPVPEEAQEKEEEGGRVEEASEPVPAPAPISHVIDPLSYDPLSSEIDPWASKSYNAPPAEENPFADPIGDAVPAAAPTPASPLFAPQEEEPARKASPPPAAAAKSSLFGDEDDVFGAPTEEPKKEAVKSSSALFDDDDDSVFAAPSPAPAAKKAETPKKPSASLFGDDEEEGDLFGDSWLSKKTAPKQRTASTRKPATPAADLKADAFADDPDMAWLGGGSSSSAAAPPAIPKERTTSVKKEKKPVFSDPLLDDDNIFS